MNRKLKALGVAVVAVLAMSAVVASGAQATKFTAAEYPASLHGTQPEGAKHSFKYGSATVECSTATFAGTLSEASSEVGIEPTYEGCHVIILGTTFPATVTKSGSKPCYTFKVTGTDKEALGDVDKAEGDVHVNCSLTIDIYSNASDHAADKTLCVIHVEPQTAGGTVTYEATTAPTPDVLHVYAKNVTVAATRTGSALCGAASGTGTYNGKVTVGAKDKGGNPIDGGLVT